MTRGGVAVSCDYLCPMFSCYTVGFFEARMLQDVTGSDSIAYSSISASDSYLVILGTFIRVHLSRHIYMTTTTRDTPHSTPQAISSSSQPPSSQPLLPPIRKHQQPIPIPNRPNHRIPPMKPHRMFHRPKPPKRAIQIIAQIITIPQYQQRK